MLYSQHNLQQPNSSYLLIKLISVVFSYNFYMPNFTECIIGRYTAGYPQCTNNNFLPNIVRIFTASYLS